MRAIGWVLVACSARAAVSYSSTDETAHFISKASTPLLINIDSETESNGPLPLVSSAENGLVDELGNLTGTLMGPTSTTANPPLLQVSLINNSTQDVVYAYVTGCGPDNHYFLLKADGKTLHYPTSNTSTPQQVSENVTLRLPGPGEALNISIPSYIQGGRIWFSYSQELSWQATSEFQLVTPSSSDPHNANYDIQWGFCELSYNSEEIYVNLSSVDFVAMSISLILDGISSGRQTVAGLPRSTKPEQIHEMLKTQTGIDGQPWDKLTIYHSKNDSTILRILSPATYLNLNSSIFSGYFEPFIDAVWSHFTSNSLIVNSQGQYGNLEGRVGSTGSLDFFNPNSTQFTNLTQSYNLTQHHYVKRVGANSTTVPAGVIASFIKPSAADIFSCNSGPFAANSLSNIGLAIVPRLAAAINRGTLLLESQQNMDSNMQPNGVPSKLFYPSGATAEVDGVPIAMNHYSRIIHEVEVDGRGYAFPVSDPCGAQDGFVLMYEKYDDVVADGGNDISGSVFASDPKVLTVVVGGIA